MIPAELPAYGYEAFTTCKLYLPKNTMSLDHNGFTVQELRRLRRWKDPYGIQKILDGMPYHLAATAWSPRRTLRENTAHCFEGAMLAAAVLRVIGFPPLVFDLEGEQDSDHVLAIYRVKGCWGAIGKSNFSGLRYREPVYRSLRELAMSYFENYFNLRGQRSLRAFSRPVNLARFDRLQWMVTEKPLWFVAEHLCAIRHYKVLQPGMNRRLHRLDDRSFRAGCVGRSEEIG